MTRAKPFLRAVVLFGVVTLMVTTEPTAHGTVPVPQVLINADQARLLFDGRAAKLAVASTVDGDDSAAIYLVDFTKQPSRAEFVTANVRVIRTIGGSKRDEDP